MCLLMICQSDSIMGWSQAKQEAKVCLGRWMDVVDVEARSGKLEVDC
jgi:hypothetical protein